MNIERRHHGISSDDTARWGYTVADDADELWDVEITSAVAGKYYWTVGDDPLLLADNWVCPAETEQLALDAAVEYIKQHRSVAAG